MPHRKLTLTTRPMVHDDPRVARHQVTKARILREAWKLARRHGVGGVTLGDLATRVGLRQPSLYTYFESKSALYDAMFAQSNQELWDAVATRAYPDDSREAIKEMTTALVTFYSADAARAQLLFQRPVPGYKPSREAYAPVGRFFEWARDGLLAATGVIRDGDIDIYVALVRGLSDQQVTNDPGGDRWLRQVDEVIDMFLDHIEAKHRE